MRRVAGDHGRPADEVSLGHFIEQVAGFLKQAFLAEGFDEFGCLDLGVVWLGGESGGFGKWVSSDRFDGVHELREFMWFLGGREGKGEGRFCHLEHFLLCNLHGLLLQKGIVGSGIFSCFHIFVGSRESCKATISDGKIRLEFQHAFKRVGG